MRNQSNAVRTAIVSGVVAATLSLSAHAALFTNLLGFGDSLMDTGNVFIATGGVTEPTPFPAPFPGSHALVPGAPYAEGAGRFSNGPVWVETLAASLGVSASPGLAGGTNFAFGGARTGPTGAGPTPPLVDQLAGFLAGTGGVAPSGALYALWGGANDIRDAVGSLSVDPTGTTAATIVAAAVANIAAMVGDLVTAGALHILVPNLPDLGLTPSAQRLEAFEAPPGTFPFAGTVAASTALSASFNAQLAGALAPFGGIAKLLDVHALVNEVIASPATFGLANVTDPCVDVGSICGNPDDYLFWDGIHPGTAAHDILARRALQLVPEPAALLLLAAGLVLVAVSRVRSPH